MFISEQRAVVPGDYHSGDMVEQFQLIHEMDEPSEEAVRRV